MIKTKIPIVDRSFTLDDIPPIFSYCENCKLFSTELSRCKRCYSVCYCNEKCQKADWKIHKNICGKSIDRPIQLCVCGCGKERTQNLTLIIKSVEKIVHNSAHNMKDFSQKQYQETGIRGAVCITERSFVVSTCFKVLNFSYMKKEDIDSLNVEENYKIDLKNLIDNYKIIGEFIVVIYFPSQHLFQYAQLAIRDVITHEEVTEILSTLFKEANPQNQTDSTVKVTKGNKSKNKQKKVSRFEPVKVEVNEELINALNNIQYDTDLWGVE